MDDGVSDGESDKTTNKEKGKPTDPSSKEKDNPTDPTNQSGKSSQPSNAAHQQQQEELEQVGGVGNNATRTLFGFYLVKVPEKIDMDDLIYAFGPYKSFVVEDCFIDRETSTTELLFTQAAERNSAIRLCQEKLANLGTLPLTSLRTSNSKRLMHCRR